MEAVSYEKALEEVNAWLDAKKVKTKKREAYKDAVENLASAISEGTLSLGENNELIQLLSFPVKNTAGGVEFDKLSYKPRLTLSDVQQATKNVKPGDADGRILAYASALTDKPIGLLSKIDTEDNTILQSITVFFL